MGARFGSPLGNYGFIIQKSPLFFWNCKNRPPELKDVDFCGSEGRFLGPFYAKINRDYYAGVYGQIFLPRCNFNTFWTLWVHRHAQSTRSNMVSWRHHLSKSKKSLFLDSRSVLFPDGPTKRDSEGHFSFLDPSA